MLIVPVRNMSFGHKIIDYHTHTGDFFGEHFDKKDLDPFVEKPLPNGDVVEKMLVSDMDAYNYGKNEFLANQKIYKKIKNDDKYLLMLSCSPKNGSVDRIERFIKKYPHAAKGLKFHPNAQSLGVFDDKYEPYFQLADKYELPCLFHSTVPCDKNGNLYRNYDGTLNYDALDYLSDPEAIYEVAKRHPKTPFIIAHMGSGWRESHDRTIDILVESVKNGDANLYCDISWVDIDSEPIRGHQPKGHIIRAIKELKGINNPDWDKGDQSHRLIFGTDAPIARFSSDDKLEHYTDFIDEIKYAIRNDGDLAADSEQIIEDIFYNNAKKLIDNSKA